MAKNKWQKINGNQYLQIINYNGKFCKYYRINISDNIKSIHSLDRINTYFKN